MGGPDRNDDRAANFAVGGAIAAAMVAAPAFLLPPVAAAAVYVLAGGALAGYATHRLTRNETLPPSPGEQRAERAKP